MLLREAPAIEWTLALLEEGFGQRSPLLLWARAR